jgi:hypothetical protein
MPTRLAFFSVLIVLAIASSASAQAQQPATPQAPAAPAQTSTALATPTFEVGLGYQFVRAGELCIDDNDEDCSSSYNYPLGFAIDGVRNFGHLGIVGEIGWSRHGEDTLGGVSGISFSEHLFHYAGGVRWTGHNAGRIWPYGQVLLGGATIHASIDIEDDNGQNDDDEPSDTRTKFMIQPGIGVTVVGGDGWGLFGQVDYRRLFLDEDEDGSSGRNDVQVFVGVRLMLD